MQPHPKDNNRNTAPRQDAPGRQMSKTQRTPQRPQDQDASSFSDPNPEGTHSRDPTLPQAQVRQQGKKPIPETGKIHPHHKNENRGTAPSQDAGPLFNTNPSGAHSTEPTSSLAQARQQGGRPT